jgi:hypothetical protein
MRSTPPHASFFSKFNKKEKRVEGPYEEKFLNTIESWQWEQKKMLKRRGVGFNANV